MDGCPPDVGYVALSRFEVTEAFVDATADAFRDRPHLVEDAPGFVRLDVLRPVVEPAQFWLLTYWTDEDAFRTWHRSHDRTRAHRGMPDGLRLVPGSFELSGFQHVTA